MGQLETVFFQKFNFKFTQRLGVAAMLLRSLKQVFWKKSAFYVHCLRNKSPYFLKFLKKITDSVCVYVCVYQCVCVCVCVCVCLYSYTVKASSDFKMSKTYLRGTDRRSYVVNIYLGASARLPYLRIWKCHISPPKTKTAATTTWRGNDMIYS